MLECPRIQRYSFLNSGYNRKIIFIDSEGTKQDGSLEADIGSIVSIVLSTHSFIHCEKIYYGDIPTMNKILEIMKQLSMESAFSTTKFSILIKGGIAPPDITTAMDDIKDAFKMLQYSSVFFIPPPDSVRNAVNEKSNFSDAMKKALKESVENNFIPIPYATWKNSLNFTIRGIETIPDFQKHPDSPIGIKTALSSLSQLFKNRIPSREEYKEYINNLEWCLTLYCRSKSKPEDLSRILEEIKNLAHKIFHKQNILKLFLKEIKKCIDNVEKIMQNGLENIRQITVTVKDGLSEADATKLVVEAANAFFVGPFALILPAIHTIISLTKTHKEEQQVREINLDFKQLVNYSLESSFMQIVGITLFYELNLYSILERSGKCISFNDNPSSKMVENWINKIVKGFDKKVINSIISESSFNTNRTSVGVKNSEQDFKKQIQEEWKNIILKINEKIYSLDSQLIGNSLISFVYEDSFDSSIGLAKLNRIKKIISCYIKTIKKIIKDDQKQWAEKLMGLISKVGSLFQI